MFSHGIAFEAAILITNVLVTAGDTRQIGLGEPSNELDFNGRAGAIRCNTVLDTHIDAFLSTFKAPGLNRKCDKHWT